MTDNLTTTEIAVTIFDECNQKFVECQVQRYMFLVFGPLLLLMSVVGGSLGVAVMTRKALRNTAAAVFIGCLSVSDMLAVLTGLIRHFTLKASSEMDAAYQIDLRKLSPASCKIHRFTLYMALDTSAWILIAISVERFLAVYLPHHHHLLKTPRRAAMVVCGILAFQLCFNFPVLFIWGEQEKVNGNITKVKTCGFTSPGAENYWTMVHSYVALANYCAIPFLSMLVLNILIITKLKKINRISSRYKSSNKARQATTSSMTRMLLCVTFYFIIVTTPSVIFTQIQSAEFARSVVTEEQHAKMELVDTILTIMLYVNHSINFFLYCLTGRRFRMTLRSLLLTCLAKLHIISPTTSTKVASDEDTKTVTCRPPRTIPTGPGETKYQLNKNEFSVEESSSASVKGSIL